MNEKLPSGSFVVAGGPPARGPGGRGPGSNGPGGGTMVREAFQLLNAYQTHQLTQMLGLTRHIKQMAMDHGYVVLPNTFLNVEGFQGPAVLSILMRKPNTDEFLVMVGRNSVTDMLAPSIQIRGEPWRAEQLELASLLLRARDLAMDIKQARSLPENVERLTLWDTYQISNAADAITFMKRRVKALQTEYDALTQSQHAATSNPHAPWVAEGPLQRTTQGDTYQLLKLPNISQPTSSLYKIELHAITKDGLVTATVPVNPSFASSATLALGGPARDEDIQRVAETLSAIVHNRRPVPNFDPHVPIDAVEILLNTILLQRQALRLPTANASLVELNTPAPLPLSTAPATRAIS